MHALISHTTTRQGRTFRVLRRACTHWWWLAAAAWCFGVIAHAQEQGFAFRRISAGDGLSDNYALCSLQDRWGYLWFGTRDGLNRYDGYGFTVFKNNPLDPNSIAEGGIDCMLEDHDGNLWVGSSFGGLSRYDRTTGRFTRYHYDPANPSSIAGDRIMAVAEDGHGDIWCMAGDRSANISRLCRFNRSTGRFERIGRGLFVIDEAPTADEHRAADERRAARDLNIAARGSAGVEVSSLGSDASGAIWVSIDGDHLYRFNTSINRFVAIRAQRPPGIRASHGVTFVLFESDGSVWLRIGDIGITRLQPRSDGSFFWNATPFGDSALAAQRVAALYRDHSGALWVGTMLGGLYMLDSAAHRIVHSPRNLNDPNTIASNYIFSILEDRSGNIWVGTDNGISKLARLAGRFRRFRFDPLNPGGISHERVRSVFEDRDGTLWFGTYGAGVDELRRGEKSFRHHTFWHKGLRGVRADFNIVNAIYEDRAGDLWFGTNGGLVQRDARGRFRYYINDPLDSTTISYTGIWSLLEDRQGDFWVGTLRGGLDRMDRATGRFTHYRYDRSVPGSIGSDLIHCTMEDHAGRLWIGTENGLERFDGQTGTFVHYRSSRGGLNHNRVWYLHEATDGTIWIGTSGGGINAFDPQSGHWRHYTDKDGLVNNFVCGILEDSNGDLWISTNNGISRFNPQTNRFANFTTDDGLPMYEFHFEACHRCADGALLLGGNGGVLEFYPELVRPNFEIPPVQLASFKLFGRERTFDTLIGVRRTIQLAHDENFFTIGFSALDFTNPRGNQYLYRLEGVDEAWRRADGSAPFASYTGVPPGVYHFTVLGANSDGAWNSNGATLEVIVEPAFWETVWFRCGVGAFAVLMLAAAIRHRIRRIRREANLERSAVESRLQALQAQMNPHFIFNALNAILHFVVTHDTSSAHRYLTKFSKLVRSILENSRAEYITLAEEVEALRLYLDLEMLRFEGVFEYRIEVSPAIDVHSIRIPPMLIQPYVENAIKHGLVNRASEGVLVIRLARDNGVIHCTIEDNGVGRTAAESMRSVRESTSRSMGMELTGERLRILNAVYKSEYDVQVVDLLDSENRPSGTKVEISIPVR